jgi:ribosome-associated toxin RatA of RatAB toxin-antitoxin module
LTKSVFQIDAPKDRLFGIIADFNRWNEWFPDCKQAKIVSDNGNTKQVEITLASMKTITMGLEFDLTPTQLINFRKYSGKDVKEYLGSFRLMNASDGAGTVVMGEMEMDAGSLVPKFMVGKIMEKSLAKTAEALKQRVHTAPPTPVFESAEAGSPPPTEGAAPAVAVAQARPARRKRMVHVIQSGEGYRVWLMGKTRFYKFE